MLKAIPKKYILRRWTREARCGVVQNFMVKEVEKDQMLYRTQKFRKFVSKFIKVAANASLLMRTLRLLIGV